MFFVGILNINNCLKCCDIVVVLWCAV